MMNITEYKRCLYEIDDRKLEKLNEVISQYTDIIILGNGGSNAISSHIAEDYTKLLNKRAVCFGDSARMSCYANDYGWDNAYQKFLEQFVTKDTLVILISSSGNSQNILNCAQWCIDNNIQIITLSGNSETNKLKEGYEDFSKLHFWINSSDYGIVEGLHELILHSII